MILSKRIEDPEEALLLWQAGLLVNSKGRKWADYKYRLHLMEQQEVLMMYLHGSPEHVCVLVEEDGDEGDSLMRDDESTKCDEPRSGGEVAYLQNTD